MNKKLNYCFASIFFSLILSGCVGVGTMIPNECDTNNPPKIFHDYLDGNYLGLGLNLPTNKQGVLDQRGAPDEVINISENEEIWVYNKKNRFCGAFIIAIIPIPFALPICDEFVRITFVGETIERVHSRWIDGHFIGIKPTDVKVSAPSGCPTDL